MSLYRTCDKESKPTIFYDVITNKYLINASIEFVLTYFSSLV